MLIKQYDVFVVSLDPTIGAEIQKTRPCVVVSPDQMNGSLQTVQVAPMTTNTRDYPWRVAITFQDKKGMVALDQIRTVDRRRLIRKLGKADEAVMQRIDEAISVSLGLVTF